MNSLPALSDPKLSGDLKKLEGYTLKLATIRQELTPYMGIGIPDAKQAIEIKRIKSKLVKCRTSADEYRKQIKEPFKNAVDQIDALGRTVQASIGKVENDADALLKAHEDERFRLQRQELARKELEAQAQKELRRKRHVALTDLGVHFDGTDYYVGGGILASGEELTTYTEEELSGIIDHIKTNYPLPEPIPQTPAPPTLAEPTLTGTERPPYVAAAVFTPNNREAVIRAQLAGILGGCGCREKVEEIMDDIIKPLMKP